tara:strand:- start:604 stop:876 length:273 start_codon:yes stop_codon:yes gene_type:complete
LHDQQIGHPWRQLWAGAHVLFIECHGAQELAAAFGERDKDERRRFTVQVEGVKVLRRGRGGLDAEVSVCVLELGEAKLRAQLDEVRLLRE